MNALKLILVTLALKSQFAFATQGSLRSVLNVCSPYLLTQQRKDQIATVARWTKLESALSEWVDERALSEEVGRRLEVKANPLLYRDWPSARELGFLTQHQSTIGANDPHSPTEVEKRIWSDAVIALDPERWPLVVKAPRALGLQAEVGLGVYVLPSRLPAVETTDEYYHGLNMHDALALMFSLDRTALKNKAIWDQISRLPAVIKKWRTQKLRYGDSFQVKVFVHPVHDGRRVISMKVVMARCDHSDSDYIIAYLGLLETVVSYFDHFTLINPHFARYIKAPG